MKVDSFSKSAFSGIYYLLKFITTGSKINDFKGCRILLYHSISEKHYDYDAMGLSVLPDIFQMHMKYLEDNGYNVISLLKFAEIVKNRLVIPKNTVVITFDDGYKGVKQYAEPILEECGFRATVFITVDYTEKKMYKNENMYCLNWEFMNWEDIKSLENIDVGAHGTSHHSLDLLNVEEMAREIKASKQIISEKIDKEILAFGYPFGRLNDTAINILKDTGYVCSCSNISGFNKDNADLYKLRRTAITAFDDTIDKFKEKLLGCYDWLNIWRMIYYR